MTTYLYENNRVVTVWDDTARTVTDYATDPPTVRDYTAEENTAADAALADAARLDDLAARVARIEAHLWPAPGDPTVPDDPTVAEWAALGGIWPNEGLLREGGIIWRNVSGVPLTSRPSEFPGAPEQWTHLFVEVVISTPPDPEPEWPQWVQPQPGVVDPYAKDAKVTHKDQRWTSDLDGNVWEPGVYGWTLAP